MTRKKYLETSKVITFFDIFLRQLKDDDNQERVFIDFLQTNKFEFRFLTKSICSIISILQKENIFLSFSPPHLLFIYKKTTQLHANETNKEEYTKEWLNTKDIKHLLDTFEIRFSQQINEIPYEKIVQKVVQITCKIFQSKFNFINVKPAIIKVNEIQPFNEEWSALFDTTFETAPSYNKEGDLISIIISYPNPLLFSEFHKKELEKLSWKKGEGRIERIYFHRMYRDIAHEMVHCIQNFCKQRDEFPMSWSSEFDASYLAGSLSFQFFSFLSSHQNNDHRTHNFNDNNNNDNDNKNDRDHDCNNNNKDDNWRGGEELEEEEEEEGLYEEILVTWLNDLTANLEKYPKSKEIYDHWLSCFGMVGDIGHIEGNLVDIMKDRLALELLTENDLVFYDQVHFCFYNRSGDVYLQKDSDQRVVPPLCKLQIGNSISELIRPISLSSPDLFISPLFENFLHNCNSLDQLYLQNDQ